MEPNTYLKKYTGQLLKIQYTVEESVRPDNCYFLEIE